MSAGHPGLPTRVVSAGLEGGHICYEWDLVGAQQTRTRLLPATEGCRLELGRGRGTRGPYQQSLCVCTSWGGVCGFLCHVQGSLSHVWTGATECLLDHPFQDKTCLQFPQYQVLMTRGERATGRVLL